MMMTTTATALRTLHLSTQYRENYSDDPARPYWKCKGGSTIVVTGPAAWTIEALVERARPEVEYSNPMSEEWITGWVEVAHAAVLTHDETDQIEFDGRIDSPSKRLVF
jgi:hypothetical protein